MRKVVMSMLLAVLLLAACGSSGSIEGVWEKDGQQMEIKDGVMSIPGDIPIEVEYEHLSGSEYELNIFGQTETIDIVIDGDQLTMKSIITGEQEVYTKVD